MAPSHAPPAMLDAEREAVVAALPALSALTPGILRGIFGFLGGHELADDKSGEAGPKLRPGTPGE